MNINYAMKYNAHQLLRQSRRQRARARPSADAQDSMFRRMLTWVSIYTHMAMAQEGSLEPPHICQCILCVCVYDCMLMRPRRLSYLLHEGACRIACTRITMFSR